MIYPNYLDFLSKKSLGEIILGFKPNMKAVWEMFMNGKFKKVLNLIYTLIFEYQYPFNQ